MSGDPIGRDAEALESISNGLYELNLTAERIATALERIAAAQERVPTHGTCSCSRRGDRWDVGTDHVCNAGKP